MGGVAFKEGEVAGLAEAGYRNAPAVAASHAAPSRGGPPQSNCVLHDNDVSTRGLLDKPTHLFPAQLKPLSQRDKLYRSSRTPTPFPPSPHAPRDTHRLSALVLSPLFVASD